MHASSSFLLIAAIFILSTRDVGSSIFPQSESSCNFDTWGSTISNDAGRTSSPTVVGKQTLQLSDSKRQDRPVTIDVWYPAIDNGEDLTRYNPLLPSDGFYFKALENPAVKDPDATLEMYPLLVFSHGSNGLRSQSATLMEHLASWGFVVAAPDHTGNSFNDDPSLDVPFESKDRPLDISFVIDTLLSSPYRDDFHLSLPDDPPKVGVIGNSFGGLTSALVTSGFQDVPPDPRVEAIMPISPSINFFPDDESLLSNIKVPMLVVGGENDTVTPVDPNNILFFETAMNSFPRWNTILSNAGHTSFQDTCIFFEIVLNVFAGGNVDTAYTLMGSGSLEEGKTRIEEAYCNNTIRDTLPVVNFAAVAFFTAVMFNDPAAKDCLNRLGDVQPTVISQHQFLDDPMVDKEKNSTSTSSQSDTSSSTSTSSPSDTSSSGVAPFRISEIMSLRTVVIIAATVIF